MQESTYNLLIENKHLKEENKSLKTELNIARKIKSNIKI